MKKTYERNVRTSPSPRQKPDQSSSTPKNP
jgi:hypothetical protein